MRLKVTNEQGLYRDSHSKAIINEDMFTYHKYMERQKKQQEKNAELIQLREEVNELKMRFSALLDRLESGK